MCCSPACPHELTAALCTASLLPSRRSLSRHCTWIINKPNDTSEIYKTLAPGSRSYIRGWWSTSSLSGPPEGLVGSQEPVPQVRRDAGVLQVPVPRHYLHQLLQLSCQETQTHMPQETTDKGPHSTAPHFKQHYKLIFSHPNCTDWTEVG